MAKFRDDAMLSLQQAGAWFTDHAAEFGLTVHKERRKNFIVFRDLLALRDRANPKPAVKQQPARQELRTVQQQRAQLYLIEPEPESFGVIEYIVHLLKNGGGTKDELLDDLCAKFPRRERSSMKSTLDSQLKPGRLLDDHNLIRKSKKRSNGAVHFYVQSEC